MMYGFACSLGTFVFTFVSQHTVNLTYESMQSNVRNLKNWKIVSTCAISIATCVSLTVGVTVYITFWQNAGSDLFEMYPPLRAIDFAKILLCFTMLLTFPLPFFTCRELIIVSLTHCSERETTPNEINGLHDEVNTSLQEPLLSEYENGTLETGIPPTTQRVSANERNNARRPSRLLMDGEDKQLKLGYHLVVTSSLWGLTTLLAILAPSLGDVLDLVGCATGTVIGKQDTFGEGMTHAMDKELTRSHNCQRCPSLHIRHQLSSSRDYSLFDYRDTTISLPSF